MVAEDRRYRIGAAPGVHRRPGRVEEPAGDDQQPQLERPEVVDAELDAYRAKLEAIAHAQRAGHLTSALDPIDLLILVLALTSAWFAASPTLHSLAAQDPTSPERLATHRAAVANAVRALTTAAVPQVAAATGAGRPREPA